MSNQVSRSLLLRSVKLIKQYHDAFNDEADPEIFRLYYNHSPEMKEIRDGLGTYDEIKDEVIECNSISVDERKKLSYD